jgi:RNA polymerase sigma factor for flagellar operon FliA
VNAAREATIRELFPLVRSCARRLQRMIPAAELDDLVGDGAIGLIRAVDAFEPDRGVHLVTYARRVIVGAMLNGLRHSDPVSERSRRKARCAEADRIALAHERGCLPSVREMEERHPGLTQALIAIEQRMPLSLDAPQSGDICRLENWSADPARIAARKALSSELVEALELLAERERRVVLWHYYEATPLHAIGTRLGVSAQRVSQLHLRALERLRRNVAR